MNEQIISCTQAWMLNREQRFQLICENWHLEESNTFVFGLIKLVKSKNGEESYRLFDVRNSKGELLEFFLSDLNEKQLIKTKGIFIDTFKELYFSFRDQNFPRKKVSDGNYVKAQIEIFDDKECERHQNPLLLKVLPSTVVELKEIPEYAVTYDLDGHFLVEKSIYSAYLENRKSNLEKDFALKRQQLEASHIALQNSYNQQKTELSASVSQIKLDLTKVEKEIKEAYGVQDTLAKQKQEIEQEIEVKKNSLTQYEENLKQLDQKSNFITGKLPELEKSKIDIEVEIDKLTNVKNHTQFQIEQLEKVKKELMNYAEKLRLEIKERANSLKSLGFISDEQYDELLNKPKKVDPTNMLSFETELNQNFAKLAAYLQIHLFKQNTIYPFYLLKDFITLLRTNDFIILSGLSGVGKTLLVKAVAEALGGVAKIIPVKPNWTSSEDLLGYYNPLQRAYLSTPFLDALVEARRDPERLYFICLDEMNLARVEYYFADFLSALEERSKQPEIKLYSSEEAGHVLSEFVVLQNVLEVALGTEHREITFRELLTDAAINEKLKTTLGYKDKDSESFAQLFARLQRMVTQLLNIPDTLEFPKNVRIIGAINVDQTTNTLSPKILDRAHIIRFLSPFKYDYKKIQNEINYLKEQLKLTDYSKKVYVSPSQLGEREKYPEFFENAEDELVIIFTNWAQKYFEPLGIDIGFRTIRQSLNYKRLAKDAAITDLEALNSILLYKILPRFSFDGRTKVENTEQGLVEKHQLVSALRQELEEKLGKLTKANPNLLDRPNAYEKLSELYEKADNSVDKIYNYWL